MPLAQNWWNLLLIGGFAFMMFTRGGCCGGGHSPGGQNHMGSNGGDGHDRSGQTSAQMNMVRDPECGMHVNPNTAIKQNLDGTPYYFCSEECRSSYVRKHL